MAHVQLRGERADLEDPWLVEGFPGIGLVGKIAADHLVETFDMALYATVHCEGLPRIGVYREGEREVLPPVRLYADADRDLLVLQSDVPVSPSAATEFADCVTGWIESEGVTPVYLSGRPAEKDGVPALSGVATGGAGTHLDAAGIDAPGENGAISGPTGALLHAAAERGLDAVGLVVESDPQFPDPEAARVLIDAGIEPLADVEVPVDDLVEHATDIQEQKEELAKRMREAAEDEASQAQPLRMFQ